MFTSVLLICLFKLVLNEASVQETIEAGIGESVVFRCNSGTNKLQTITAYWRYNDTLNIYDIESGRAVVTDQEPMYKRRTEMSPEQYMKGNFSLTLQRLQNSDAGIYCCFIPDLYSRQCTKLHVKENSRGIQEKPSSSREVESKAERILPLFISLFSVTVLLSCEW